MAVLPEFSPEGRPGEAADALIQGRNASESWMNMAQQRQIQAAQEQRAQDEFVAKLPVLHATAQANVAQANAAIQLSTRMQQLRAQASIVAPEANNEYLDALQLADPSAKYQRLQELQGKYSWMSTLPEYAPFTQALDKSRGDAFHMVTADNLADALLERTKTLAGSRETIASETNTTRQNIAETSAGARVGAAQIGAEARVEAAKTAASARVESAKQKAMHSYETEVTIAHRDDAIEAGDFEKAQIYQDRLNKLNSTPNNPLDRPVPKTVMRPKAPDTSTRVTPITVPGITPGTKAPEGKVTEAPKNSIKIPKGSAIPPAVTVEGKTYPVYVDKSGNAAYLKDGQYFEITEPTEEETGETQPDNERTE